MNIILATYISKRLRQALQKAQEAREKFPLLHLTTTEYQYKGRAVPLVRLP